MCTNLSTVKNPFWRSHQFKSVKGSYLQLSKRLNSTREYITVPCGKCAECRNIYYQSIFQRAVVESMTSYMYFVTLTYDNKHLPVTRIAGEDFYYFDYKHIQDMFKRFRNNNYLSREFRYIAVNEFGDKYHRPHAHLLIFVAKQSDDSELTPFIIEKILFDKLKQCFVTNIGTRKFPNYEPLFTYAHKWFNGIMQSNYFVKYVDSDTDESLYKTINYLIGYINKPNVVDEYLKHLSTLYTDNHFSHKLLLKFRSKVRYSKGFGMGFENGKKAYLHRTQFNASLTQIFVNDIQQHLPDTFKEFIDTYPQYYEKVITFFKNEDFTRYHDIDEFRRTLSPTELTYLFIAFRYKLPITSKLRCISSLRIRGVISDFYNVKKDYKYNFTKIPPTFESSNYLTSKFDNMKSFGLSNKLPFIPFIYGNNVQPICEFYKNLFCTPDDILRMYDSVGVFDYDEWKCKYNKYVLDNKKSRLQKFNEFSKNNNEIVCKLQLYSLSLSSEKQLFNLILS